MYCLTYSHICLPEKDAHAVTAGKRILVLAAAVTQLAAAGGMDGSRQLSVREVKEKRERERERERVGGAHGLGSGLLVTTRVLLTRQGAPFTMQALGAGGGIAAQNLNETWTVHSIEGDLCRHPNNLPPKQPATFEPRTTLTVSATTEPREKRLGVTDSLKKSRVMQSKASPVAFANNERSRVLCDLERAESADIGARPNHAWRLRGTHCLTNQHL